MNSKEDVVNIIELSDKLIEKTESKKLKWHEFDAQADDGSLWFRADLANEISVDVGGNEHFLWFSMVAQDTKTLLTARSENDPQYGYDSVDETTLHDRLATLYHLARRSAFAVDKRLETVTRYLESL